MSGLINSKTTRHTQLIETSSCIPLGFGGIKAPCSTLLSFPNLSKFQHFPSHKNKVGLP